MHPPAPSSPYPPTHQPTKPPPAAPRCVRQANESLPPAKKRLGFTGVLFVTYSMLVSGLKAGGTKRGRKRGGAGADEEDPKPPTPEKLERLA